MISDRRARKLFRLCDKLGIDGVKKYVDEHRFAVEKLPLIAAWIELRIESEKKDAVKALKQEKVKAEKPAKKVKKVAKKSK